MLTNHQLLYHKSLNLRAGESVKIFLGESIPVDKTHIRIDLECVTPKTLIFVLTKPNNDNKSLIRHVRADKVRLEFTFSGKEGNEDYLRDFSELFVSVPEDTKFHLGIYLQP